MVVLFIPIENHKDIVHFHFQFEVEFSFNHIKVKNVWKMTGIEKISCFVM